MMDNIRVLYVKPDGQVVLTGKVPAFVWRDKDMGGWMAIFDGQRHPTVKDVVSDEFVVRLPVTETMIEMFSVAEGNTIQSIIGRVTSDDHRGMELCGKHGYYWWEDGCPGCQSD